MGKHILVLNGSPRNHGNTEVLADALIEGAAKAGHTASKLNLHSMKINPCYGCYNCIAGKGNPCIQKDEMYKVYEELEKADVVVYASPLYWWQVSAQLKTVIDRIFAVPASNHMSMPKKEAVLLIAAEGSSEENFSHIISYYQTCLVQNIGWTDRGMVLARGVSVPGDVEKTGFIQEAVDLGASL